jgi:hypothetical protein
LGISALQMSLRHHVIDPLSVGATPVSAVRALVRAPAAAALEALLPLDLLLLARRCGTLA